MSMEEFIRQLETNPNPQGYGSGSSGDELIRVKTKRKFKDQKTGETKEEEYVDVDGKTRLTAPTSFSVAEIAAEHMEKTFGKRRGVRLLKQFLGMGEIGAPAGFKVNMISKDGLSRQEHIMLKNREQQMEEAQKSMLDKLGKM